MTLLYGSDLVQNASRRRVSIESNQRGANGSPARARGSKDNLETAVKCKQAVISCLERSHVIGKPPKLAECVKAMSLDCQDGRAVPTPRPLQKNLAPEKHQRAKPTLKQLAVQHKQCSLDDGVSSSGSPCPSSVSACVRYKQSRFLCSKAPRLRAFLSAISPPKRRRLPSTMRAPRQTSMTLVVVALRDAATASSSSTQSTRSIYECGIA